MTYVLTFVLAMAAPAAMFLIGLLWKFHPPADRSKRFAYRTALALKSEDAWRFAHKKISSLWIRIGVLTGVLTAVLMSYFSASYRDFVLWVICGQMLLLCLSSFLVDGTMKVVFDENGERAEKK